VTHDKDKFQMQGIFGNGLKAHIILEISTTGSLFWDNGINFPALTPAEVIRFYSVIIVQLWSFKLQPLTSQHIFLYLA
jgi:hypothetical protein